MTKAQHHQVIVKVNDTWETPPLILADKMTQYDIHPTLDVCGTIQNTKFPKYFTIQDNALNQEWNEDFYMNPPYSEINQWMEYAITQQKKHNVNALILVFAKTGVRWWHKYVEGKTEVHFQEGRIRFLINGVEPRHCKFCKTRFIEEIEYCKTCKHCTVCKKVFKDGPEKCENCHGKMDYQKIGKSSGTYDSAWIIFRKGEIII